MRKYDVKITMADGSQGHHVGNYGCGIDAILRALDLFPAARRIAARRLA